MVPTTRRRHLDGFTAVCVCVVCLFAYGVCLCVCMCVCLACVGEDVASFCSGQEIA